MSNKYLFNYYLNTQLNILNRLSTCFYFLASEQNLVFKFYHLYLIFNLTFIRILINNIMKSTKHSLQVLVYVLWTLFSFAKKKNDKTSYKNNVTVITVIYHIIYQVLIYLQNTPSIIWFLIMRLSRYKSASFQLNRKLN